MSESPSERQYKKISREKRFELLELIVEKKHTIKKAAEIIGVGASTARMILKRYERTGNIFESKDDVKNRKIMERIEKEKSELESISDPKTQIEPFQFPVNFVPMFYVFYPSDTLSYTLAE